MSGFILKFTDMNSRIGRLAVPAGVLRQGVSSSVRNAKDGSLRVKGVQLFNLLPANLRNSNHRDVLMFKNHLDNFLVNVPDQPTMHGMGRAAQTNSLLHQIPLIGGWN